MAIFERVIARNPDGSHLMAGGSGNKPTTPEGEALVREHNDAVRDLVSELTKIHAQPSVGGECDQCEKVGPTAK
jgi:hypothetical protein